jgi:hypothetical protein
MASDYDKVKARRLAQRAQWDEDPAMQSMNRDAMDRMNSTSKPADEKVPPPRQMLPNYYARGGPVKKGSSTMPKFCKGGKVISSKSF